MTAEARAQARRDALDVRRDAEITAERMLWREALQRPPAGVKLLLHSHHGSWFPGWWDGSQWQVLKGSVPLVTHWRYHNPKEDPMLPWLKRVYEGADPITCPYRLT